MTRNADRRILCDTHTHTLFSRHSYSTVEECVRAAAEQGLELYGATDHYSAMLYPEHNGRHDVRDFQFFMNYDVWPREWHGVQVMHGCEADIVDLEGHLFGYDVPVVAVASHDTASAVATVPRTHNGQPTAYLSSGTWSLMGTVTDKPVINEDSSQQNFTNEGGIDGTTRLLKNITGMWILEQCRKEWKAEGKQYDHTAIIKMAESVQHVPDLFNPDDRRFANPGNMLQEVCNGRNLTDAEIMSCIFHSLAHRYGEVFRMLQKLLPDPIGALYIIGGGAKNTYLNRLTEESTGKQVTALPIEATALGNIRIQLKGGTDT